MVQATASDRIGGSPGLAVCVKLISKLSFSMGNFLEHQCVCFLHEIVSSPNAGSWISLLMHLAECQPYIRWLLINTEEYVVSWMIDHNI